MISGLFIFNYKGDLLLSRIYRGNDVGRSAADAFRVNVIHSRHEVRSPVMTIGHTTFLHMHVNDVWICCVTRTNSNAAMIFEFMRKTVEVFENYCSKFNEEAVKANFIVMYEVLDEILDFGYPQRTDQDILKLCITQEADKKDKKREDPTSITSHVTGAPTWRREGIKYRKNEVFLDVIENVNMLMSSQGKELSADVTGSVMMKCYLTGMPECKFGLNDKLSLEKRKGRSSNKGVEIDDVSFHPCVRMGSGAENGISFIPPDGEFELMKYRTADGIKAPFRVIPIVRDVGRSRIEAKVVLKAIYSSSLVANNVELRLPVPKSCAKVHVTASSGRARYKAGDNCIIWKIKKFSGNKEAQMSAEIDLIATTDRKTNAVNKAPISLQFQVPMFTASGLQVRFLKVLEPKLNYDTIKWVRYLSRAGQFETRI